jgi:hypothetical protein
VSFKRQGPITLKRKRVQVVFTNEQWALIEKFRGDFGDGDAEIVRNIVLAWLSEKSIISTNAKSKMGINTIQPMR